MAPSSNHKVVIVGAGPVGSLAALYAAARGDEVEVYELRGGKPINVTPTVVIQVYSLRCCFTNFQRPNIVYVDRSI